MTRLESDTPTPHGAKYISQLCKHWSHKLDVEFSDTDGVVRFAAAVARFHARPEILHIEVEAQDDETAERMAGVVAAHLDRFAFREAPLSYSWKAAA